MTTFTKLRNAVLCRLFGNFFILGCWILTCISLPPLTYSIPIDNALIGSETKTECRNGKAIDLAFILDGSGSIGNATFEYQKVFVNMVIDRLNIAGNETRVAAVQFSDEPVLEFGFNSHPNEAGVKLAVSKIKYLAGTTRTGEALRFASENVYENIRRDSISLTAVEPVKTAVVITDGRAQDDVATPAEKLRSMGVITYAIGVTDSISVDQLLQITGGAQQRVFTVESFEKLDQPFSALLTKELCKTTYEGNALDITCSSDSIGIQAKTKYPFEGNVFVKGYFHSKGCKMTADSFAANPTLIGLTVPFDNCGIRRYRSLNPRGVFVEAVVVFSFHPRFLTKVDQAIKVQCFYMEALKTVHSDLDVSMFTPEFITRTVPMPTCSYTLRKDHPDGPLVRYALIGEAIFHRWECIQQNEQQDIFGMLVHSCFVEDGQGNQVKLLDSKGCGLDIHLLATPIYNESTGFRVAYKETHVFKFADKPILQFQCQVMICSKVDGGCTGITPPDCSKSRARRDSSNMITWDKQDQGYQTLDVIADSISVFESDDSEQPGENLQANQATYPHRSSHACFAYITFLMILIFTVSFNVIVLIFIFICVKMRRRIL